jgi:hypothetical protein
MASTRVCNHAQTMHGPLGSQYWARNPHKTNYQAKYGILLDMVGASDAVFTMEGTSMFYAPDIMKKVWDVAHQIGYGSISLIAGQIRLLMTIPISMKLSAFPTIDIIHYGTDTYTGFFEQWHTLGDNMDVIDKNTLKATGKTVLTVIYLEDH